MEKIQKISQKLLPLLLVLIMILSSIPILVATAATESETHTIDSTSSTIRVDGKKVTARLFWLFGENKDYVKIRDIANALKDTDKKFSVNYSSSKKTFTIKLGKSYTVVGGENKKFASKTKIGLIYDSGITVYKDSKKQSAKVFVFNKEQYISVESLATIADISLTKLEAEYGYTYKIDTKQGNIENLILEPIVIKDTSGVLQNPFPEAKLNKNPKTVEDCKHIYEYLMLHNMTEYSFVTDVPYKDLYKKGGLYRIFNDAFDANETPELYYALLGGPIIDFKSSKGGTKVLISFSGHKLIEGKPFAIKLNEYFTKTQAAVQSIIDSGAITTSMTETEKAYQIYKWVALNVEYDYESTTYTVGVADMGSTGYNAIVDKKAVCTGFTALYNLMCRFVGLYEIQTMVGQDTNSYKPHMWTGQILDGQKVITDATGRSIDYYFALSAKDYKNTGHKWVQDLYPKWNSAPGIDREIINNISALLVEDTVTEDIEDIGMEDSVVEDISEEDTASEDISEEDIAAEDADEAANE